VRVLRPGTATEHVTPEGLEPRGSTPATTIKHTYDRENAELTTTYSGPPGNGVGHCDARH